MFPPVNVSVASRIGRDDAWYEVMPLTFGRGRIVLTDGVIVDEFW